MDLYHRTSPEAAIEITRSGHFISRCQDPEHAFFTDSPGGKRSRQYGQALVRVVVPVWAALVDEVYSDETYVRVRLEDLVGCSAEVVTFG